MRNYVHLFKDGKINQDKKEMINDAMYCMDKFSKYFEDLNNQGFTKTIVDYREVILVCEDKVHLK